MKYKKLYNKSLMNIDGGRRKHPYMDCGLGIAAGSMFGALTGHPFAAGAGAFLGAEQSCYTDAE